MKNIFLTIVLSIVLFSCTSAPKNYSNYNEAFKKTKEFEGSNLYRSKVSTEVSKFGIQQKDIDMYNRNHGTRWRLNRLTEKQAMKIVKEHYWDRYKVARLKHQPLANQVFDYIYNAGVNEAVKVLQGTINEYYGMRRVDVDGVMGSKTIKYANKAQGNVIYSLYKENRLEKYKQKKYFYHYGRGWTRRIKSI